MSIQYLHRTSYLAQAPSAADAISNIRNSRCLNWLQSQSLSLSIWIVLRLLAVWNDRMKWPYEMAVWNGHMSGCSRDSDKNMFQVGQMVNWTQKWDRIRRRQSAPAVRLVYYMCFVFLVWLAVTKASHVVYEFWNIANHVPKRCFFCEQERASENKRKRARKREEECEFLFASFRKCELNQQNIFNWPKGNRLVRNSCATFNSRRIERNKTYGAVQKKILRFADTALMIDMSIPTGYFSRISLLPRCTIVRWQAKTIYLVCSCIHTLIVDCKRNEQWASSKWPMSNKSQTEAKNALYRRSSPLAKCYRARPVLARPAQTCPAQTSNMYWCNGSIENNKYRQETHVIWNWKSNE